MTAHEAATAILRAANYLRQLSLEDSGTGTEAELADGLIEAVKVVANMGGLLDELKRIPEVAHELASGG